MTQTVDGLMRLTGRSVNEPAGNPVSAEQWFYDGESNRQSDGISVTLKRFQPADPTGKHRL